MPNLGDAAKRLLVGRPMRSDRLGYTLLPKRLALPAFASDALSSVAYAPDEILLTLSLAGLAAYTVSPWVGLAVVVVMLTVVTSYRHTVRAYPSGGGAYEVASTNLGRGAGLTVAGALLVDYVLTVAVSISSGTQYLATVVPAAAGHEAGIAMGAVAVLALLNLRGVRESGSRLAGPVYIFMASMGVLAVVGAVQWLTGSLAPAASADLTVVAQSGMDEGIAGVAGGLLILRAFSSGSAALTGVEAIANGVPNFRKPKSRNAGITLLMLGALGSAMLLMVLLLARATGVRFVEDPTQQLLRDGVPVGPDYVQNPVIGQLAGAVFRSFPPMFYVLTISVGVILLLAANTAFNGFPILGSRLARDGYLPRQLYTRGDRLTYSNGIVLLSLTAIMFIWLFDAQVTRLIQLYIVGVFVSFTLCQLGMVRHWGDVLRTEVDARVRRRVRRSRAVNAFGFVLTGLVLVVVLITKATHGAWVTLVVMAILILIMTRINRHYASVRAELTVTDYAAERALPSRVHAVVLVSQVHKPTMRALAYARATRPSTLQALTVAVEPEDATTVRRAWDATGVPIPLTVVDSPYREITRPIVEFVKNIRRESPRDLVVVYIPEYVVDHWWAQVLHNQSALRLKSRLLFTRGVVVASVPWRLGGDGPKGWAQ